MREASLIHIRLLLLIPTRLFPNDIVTLLFGGASAFVLAFVFTFVGKAFCFKVGCLVYPAPRLVHKRPVPCLGGMAMVLTSVLASLSFCDLSVYCFAPH